MKTLIFYFFYLKVASLVSSLEQTIETNKLDEKTVHELNEIEEALKVSGKVKVEKNHLQLLGAFRGGATCGPG